MNTRPASKKPYSKRKESSWNHRFQGVAVSMLVSLSHILPYRQYIAFIGWIGEHCIGPIAGFRKRIRKNLLLVMPGLQETEIRRLCRKVPNNMARALAESFSGKTFIDHVKHSSVEGDGWVSLREARDAKQPVVLVTAHFGNYDAARVILRNECCDVAGLYMPMRNKQFNERYVAAMSRISTPIYPRDRAGLLCLLKHLGKGGMIGLVVDQHISNGELIDFMGVPARTALSAAQIALKHSALLIPCYSIRQKDGLSFRIRIEAPIPHTDPTQMTQALNQSIEKMVYAHMEQWMWTHRRWKDNKPR